MINGKDICEEADLKKFSRYETKFENINIDEMELKLPSFEMPLF